jgi:hypothetical protein
MSVVVGGSLQENLISFRWKNLLPDTLSILPSGKIRDGHMTRVSAQPLVSLPPGQVTRGRNPPARDNMKLCDIHPNVKRPPHQI